MNLKLNLLVRHEPQWHRHDRRGSAVVLSLITVAQRKTVNIAVLRGGTAETLNMFKTSAVLPRVGPMSVGSPRHRHYHRGTAITAVPPHKDRSSTSITAVPAQHNRRAIAKKSTDDPTAIPWRFYCGYGGYGGATTMIPPHWPRGATANTAVMRPMIVVAPPSNRSCNSMGSPCPLSHRCGSAAPRRKTQVWRVDEIYYKILAVSLRWWRIWPKTVVAPRLRCDGGAFGRNVSLNSSFSIGSAISFFVVWCVVIASLSSQHSFPSQPVGAELRHTLLV